MKNYYELFVKLCEQLCSNETFSSKDSVKAHNSAMKKLIELQKEMREHNGGSLDVFNKLLEHTNDVIKLQAATICLQEDTLREKSIEILKEIQQNSLDSMCRFNAKMVLQYAILY